MFDILWLTAGWLVQNMLSGLLAKGQPARLGAQGRVQSMAAANAAFVQRSADILVGRPSRSETRPGSVDGLR